ncbi:MAG: sodium ion-translocating decarboxylase subunit beta, partial [Butyricicoccus sp.]
MDFSITAVVSQILGESGYAALLSEPKTIIMILISFVLLYMGIAKKFEPLLLVPIAFGMLLANLPSTGIMEEGGLLYYFYKGVEFDIYPPLIFLGVGAMTDFGPLIARPSSLILGAAAQFGIFTAFLGSMLLCGFPVNVAAAIGIIGGADGPTAIMVTSQLAPEYLSAIAIAAYSYMALIPMIQPPIMKAFTSKKNRAIKMTQLREVSKTEKIIFPIAVATVVILLLPDTAPLIGMLMLGNLFKESGVTDRLSDTAQNALVNVLSILLGTSVGATAAADTFLTPQTLMIIAMGLIAFCLSTFGGILFGNIMCWVTKGKVNPLIGSAGVSAVPMAARVAQQVGQKENPSNFLLMHAMGPNVAGVIGS